MFTRRMLLAISAAALVLAACSTASVRVMPGAGEVHRVVARDVEKHEAEEAAFEAALAYCADRGKEAAFISDEVAYEGEMDEAERTALRKQAEAATILGGVIRATEARDAAVVFEGAGAVGSTVTSGKDYTAEVRFTCKAP